MCSHTPTCVSVVREAGKNLWLLHDQLIHTLVCGIFGLWKICTCSNDIIPPKNSKEKPGDFETLDRLARTFTTELCWDEVREFGLLNRCNSSEGKTSGKVLTYCKDMVTSFREKMGIRVCIFKVGVTSNPVSRYIGYKKIGFQAMWVINSSTSVELTHMLEAALIALFGHHIGCRNRTHSGGEGALGRNQPPFYVYITGGRADQHRAVG